ncbi:uncharacterized protein LOC115635603 [Gopherus evgoodei]|uniref:uncharacterized protein LOC115635603 n=1 Tax=Gopherus evgoodei TaxID=1825980 RepID=UPI0011CF0C54|nr:uncharacterized protein LOC115635603 [Gopherus evgoodei]
MCSVQHHPIWPGPLGATRPAAHSPGGERETLAGLAPAAGGHRPRGAMASAVPCQEEQPNEATGGRGAKRARSRQPRRAQGTAGDRCEARKVKNQPPPECRERAAGAKPAPACPEGNGGGEDCAEPRAGGSRLPPRFFFLCVQESEQQISVSSSCFARCNVGISSPLPQPARLVQLRQGRYFVWIPAAPARSECEGASSGPGERRACSRGHARSSLPICIGKGRGAGRKGSSVCPGSGRGRAQEPAAPLLSRGRGTMRLGTRKSRARQAGRGPWHRSKIIK